MVSYYPTLAVIAAAGYASFRELYRHISSQGCEQDEYYTITYIDQHGIIQSLVVPVWKVIANAILEIVHVRKRYRRGK